MAISQAPSAEPQVQHHAVHQMTPQHAVSGGVRPLSSCGFVVCLLSCASPSTAATCDVLPPALPAMLASWFVPLAYLMLALYPSPTPTPAARHPRTPLVLDAFGLVLLSFPPSPCLLRLAAVACPFVRTTCHLSHARALCFGVAPKATSTTMQALPSAFVRAVYVTCCAEV